MQVATIAANGDEHIGKMITEAFEKAIFGSVLQDPAGKSSFGRWARMAPSQCHCPSATEPGRDVE